MSYDTEQMELAADYAAEALYALTESKKATKIDIERLTLAVQAAAAALLAAYWLQRSKEA